MRKIAGLIITLCLVVLITGCADDKKLNAFIRTDVTTAIDSRVAANISIVEKMRAAGLLTEDEATKLKQNLQNAASAYSGEKLASNEKTRTAIFNAVVDWRAPKFSPDSEGKMDGMEKGEWYDAHVTSYIAKEIGKEVSKIVPLFKGTGSTVTPIMLIDPQTGVDLNEKFGFEVHVLKPLGETESAKSIDEAMALVASALADDGKVNEAILSQVFEVAKDSEGKPIKLLDTTDDRYKVVKASKGSKKVGSDNKVKDDYVIDSEDNLSLQGGYNAKPGVDMVLKSNATKRDLLAVRFIEFDQDAVDRIIATIGVNPDQYLFYNNKVYVMEYPVFALDSITMTEEVFKSSFIKSDIGLNIKTGKLVRKSKDGGIYMENSDPYLSVNGAKSANEESKSSFTILGEEENGLEFLRGWSKVKVKTARVVLRDYLEATYAPGVVDNENLVVLGRKVRIKNFSGPISILFAEFYDKAGNKFEDVNGIYLKDIADFDSLVGEDPVVKRLPKEGEELGEQEATGVVTGSVLEKIDELGREIVDSIKPVSPFPGSKLGAVDSGVSSKPLFYALTVTASPFETALFSGWINNGDQTQNSLGWWQNWLASPARSYLYRINGGALQKYLENNYTFDLQQNGVVILDLKVIAAIQNQMNAENRNNTIAQYRTGFVVIGWGLMVYGMILMLAWVLDTNVDLGFNLLEKLSFKQMIATKDETIMGDRYVGIGTVAVKALIMLVVGVVLISLNVIDLILIVVKMFGGIADIITSLIGWI